MKKKKPAVEQLLSLVHEYKGNLASIARSFGISRMSVCRWVKASKELQQAVEDARETMLDNAESMLQTKVLQGDLTALIFFLKTQGYQRGYGDRTKHEIAAQHGSTEIRVIYDEPRIEIPDNGRGDRDVERIPH